MATVKEMLVNGVLRKVIEFDRSAQEIDDAVDRVDFYAGENLIDNGYFLDAINQRGAAEYRRAGYTVDRWTCSNAGLLVARNATDGGWQLTNNHSFDATAIQRIRAEFKAAGGDLGGVTIGDMVLFAVSRTLKNHPDLNAIMLDDTTIRRYNSVNLAVAVDTPRGLMVPVIFGADKKSLVEISKELKQLAADARSGSINPDLLRGGSFTVSNLGAFGVESFTPVINPPQTGILGVCNITPKARQTAAGGYEFYPAMGLSLTYDHRAVDGAPAAKFAKELCSNLENFTALLMKD